MSSRKNLSNSQSQGIWKGSINKTPAINHTTRENKRGGWRM